MPLYGPGGAAAAITNVIAGAGATGGGAAGPVTIDVGQGFGTVVNANDIAVDPAVMATRAYVDTAVLGMGDITSVIAGAGLINGGISGAVTLDVGQGFGITVNADDVAVNQNAAFSWTTNHVWTKSDAATNGAAPATVGQFNHASSAGALAGYNSVLKFGLQDAAGTMVDVVGIMPFLSTATGGGASSGLAFQTISNGGALTTNAWLNQSGAFYVSSSLNLGSFNQTTGASTNVCIYSNGGTQIQWVGAASSVGGFKFAVANNTSGIKPMFTIVPGSHTGSTISTEVKNFDYQTHTHTWATGAITTQREIVFNAPTYAFSGTSTIADAATVAISGAPIPGTNATITNPWSLWTQDGTVRHDRIDAAAANIIEAARFVHTSSVNTTAGVGSYISFWNTNAVQTLREYVRINAMMSVTTDGVEKGIILFQGASAGAIINIGHVSVNGLYHTSMLAIGSLSAIGVASDLATITIATNMLTYKSASVSQGGHSFVGLANSSGARQYFVITPSSNTGSTLSTEIKAFEYQTYTHTWATGTIAVQRECVFNAPTYAFVGASTITTTATVAITGAPLIGSNATITNPYALWIQANANGGGVLVDQYIDHVEMVAPAAPPANTARTYCDDNGSGKSRLMVRFPTGAVQQLAIEP